MFDETADWYLLAGVVCALLSLLLIPIAGLGAVYCGYRIHGDRHPVYSYALAGVGAFSLAGWAAYLLS